MSDAADEVAQKIADVVYDAVWKTKYCQQHVADTARRATFLAVHQYLSALMAHETDESWDPKQIRETAKRYDERRKAEEDAGWRDAFAAAFAARKRAVGV